MLIKLGQKGFTLLEVMLSITILSLLMVYVFTITDDSIDTKDRIVTEDREYLQIQTALNRFEMDLSQIYSPLYFSIPKIDARTPGLQGEGIFDNSTPKSKFIPSEKYPLESNAALPIPLVETQDQQTFVFMTSSNRRKSLDDLQSRYAWVRYELKDHTPLDEENPSEALKETQDWIRSSVATNPYRKDFDWDSVRAQPILQGVKDFKFEFWDIQNKRFVSLLRDLPRDNVTPRLVRLSFTWVSSGGDTYPIVRTYRPLWPFFDRDAELALHVRILREQAQAKRQTPGDQPPNEVDLDEGDQGGFF